MFWGATFINYNIKLDNKKTMYFMGNEFDDGPSLIRPKYIVGKISYYE